MSRCQPKIFSPAQDRRPTLRLAVASAITVLALLVGPAAACDTNPLALLDTANKWRRASGLGALVPEPRLALAAGAQARHAAETGTLSHHGRAGHGLGPRIAETGYPLWNAGEALAAGPDTAPDVIALWAESAPHKAVLAAPEHTEAGAGNAVGGDGMCYWVLIVAQPRPSH